MGNISGFYLALSFMRAGDKDQVDDEAVITGVGVTIIGRNHMARQVPERPGLLCVFLLSFLLVYSNCTKE